MAIIRGHLINVYYTSKGGKLLLHWILRNSSGKQHVITPSHHPPYCFVSAEDIDAVRAEAKANNIPITITKEENARFMQEKGVPYRVTTVFPKQIGKLNRFLKTHHIKLHEADILYSWRVKVDAGIKAYVEIDASKRTYKPYEPTTQEIEEWKYKLNAWDIETTYTKKPNPKVDRIVSIAVGNKFFCDDDEATIIRQAWKYMDTHDILLDWNGKNFDRWFLRARITILKLRLNIKTVQFIDYQKAFIYLHPEINSPFISLNEVGKRFANMEKITLKHPPAWYFENDRKTLQRYNLRDNHIVLTLDNIFNFSDIYLYISTSVGVPVSDMYFVSRIPLLIYLRAAFGRNPRIIVPCTPTYDGEASSYKGGKVFETVPGVHTDVFGMDLASSYVNIIRTFNCSPEMWDEQEGKFRQNEDGIIRLEIMRLQSLRMKYKLLLPDDKNDPLYKTYYVRQYAVKVMALIFYGELGRGPTKDSPQGSRLYIRNGAAHITEKGRDLIEEASETAKEQFGAILIYGDTDSIYIKTNINLDGCSQEFIRQYLEQIIKIINKRYKIYLDTEGVPEEHRTVEMEIQGYYPSFYITEAKKKYIYYLAYDGKTWYDPFYFGFVGMDFLRRETIPLIKKIQRKVSKYILDKKPIDEIVRFIYTIRPKLFKGAFDKHLIFSYNLTKDPDEYSNTPPYVRAAKKAKKLGVKDVRNIRYIVKDSRKKQEIVEPIIEGTVFPRISRSAYDFYWGRIISTMQNTLSPLIDTNVLKHRLLGKGVLNFD